MTQDQAAKTSSIAFEQNTSIIDQTIDYSARSINIVPKQLNF